MLTRWSKRCTRAARSQTSRKFAEHQELVRIETRRRRKRESPILTCVQEGEGRRKGWGRRENSNTMIMTTKTVLNSRGGPVHITRSLCTDVSPHPRWAPSGTHAHFNTHACSHTAERKLLQHSTGAFARHDHRPGCLSAAQICTCNGACARGYRVVSPLGTSAQIMSYFYLSPDPVRLMPNTK